MLYSTYHLKLELSFLMDEFAIPPAPDNSSILIDEVDNQSETTLHSSSPASQSQLSLQSSSPANHQSQMSLQNSPLNKQSNPSLQNASLRANLSQTSLPNSPLANQSKDNEQTALSEKTPGSQPSCENKTEIVKTETKPKSDTDKDNGETSKEEKVEKTVTCDKSTPENKTKKALKHGSRTRDSSEILDFSDPLQNYQETKDETIFHSQGTLQEDKAHKLKFKKALKEVQLSVSPLMRHTIPFLETEQGQQSKMRKFFKGQLYCSEHFNDHVGNRKNRWMSEDQTNKKEPKVQLAAPHPFIQSKLTAPITDPNTQVCIESFDGFVCCLLLVTFMPCSNQQFCELVLYANFIDDFHAYRLYWQNFEPEEGV